jgi:Asp/Glu/hydantoin racemase
LKRSAPILKPMVESAFIAESVRRRVAGEPLRVGGEVRQIAQADPAQTARPDEGPEAAIIACVGDARVGRPIAQRQLDDPFI